MQPQADSQRLARRSAAATAARSHLPCRRQSLRPILDRDRRVDDALTPRSPLHECRARREALTSNLRLPSPFCGRHHVAARSMARASTSPAVRRPSLRPCRETPFAPALVPQTAGARSTPITHWRCAATVIRGCPSRRCRVRGPEPGPRRWPTPHVKARRIACRESSVLLSIVS
jgi:hypothetical protein